MPWLSVVSGCSDSYDFIYPRFEDLSYHRHMAVIHISRTEAAHDFDGLIARVTDGDEIIIDDSTFPVVMTRASRQPGRLLSEIIASAEAHGSSATLDEDFGRDLEDVINSHREPLDPPAWD